MRVRNHNLNIIWFKDMKLRNKLIFNYICFGLLPLLLVGAFGIYKVQTVMFSQEAVRNQDYLKQAVSALNGQLKVYDNLSNYISFSSSVSRICEDKYESEYNRYLDYTEGFHSLVGSMKYFHDEIQRITLYVDKPIVEYEDSIMPTKGVKTESWYEVVKQDNEVHWFVSKDKKKVFSARKIPSLSDEKMNHILYIEIDYGTLFDWFENMTDTDYGVYLVDEEEEILYEAQKFSKGNRDQILDFSSVKEEGEKQEHYIVTKQEIGENGWSVYLYRSSDGISQKINGILKEVIWGVIVSIILSVFFIRLITNHTVKGIENKEAEEQMLKIIETFRLESSIEEKVIYTFDVWSDFGIMAPTLFQQPEELTAEDLRELYTYYCASTCTPVYRWEKTSEQWKENGSYKQDSYVKVDELYSFGEKYFGMDDLSVADFPQTEDAVALNSNMVLLNYDDSSLQNKRPKNWLNDVYLSEGKEQDDRITLKLRYYYTRTTSMPELESLDCTVTAKWTENGPLFESCRITDTVPAALEPNFIRTEAQLPSEILSQVDPSHPSSIIDALYLGLEWEKQGYIVYQEDMVNYTLYTQITDAGSKEMGLPKEDVFTGYSYIPVLNCLADGNYKRPFEYYLLSYSTGKIVSLSEEENEVILRGTIEGKKELLQKIFE